MTAVIHMYLKTTKYVETLLILLNKNLNNVQSFAFLRNEIIYEIYKVSSMQSIFMCHDMASYKG